MRAGQLLLQRFSELWRWDLWRLSLVREETEKVRANLRQLLPDQHATESDRVRSHTELSSALVLVQARLEVAEANLAARLAAGADRSRTRTLLDDDRATGDATLATVRATLAAAWAI